MKRLLALLLFASSAHAINVNGPCPQTVGTLTVSVTPSRSSGIAPLMVWYDATASTDSATLGGGNTVAQDVYFSWNYGDTLASGTGTWAYGANPNHNSMNTGTGIVGAHLYQTAGRDTKYTATVTAFDGTNTVKCGVGVTAFDPNGSNGFPAAATICYFNSTVGSGCPAGATQTASSTIVAGNMTNVRRLFKCGDTFTSAGVTVSGTKGTIGAYGSCVGTTTNRPIFKATAIVDGLLTPNNPSTDIRITDIAFDGNCSGGGQSGSLACTGSSGTIIIDNQNGGSINTGNKPIQYTFYNVDAKNQFEAYMWNAGGQMALIASTAQAVWQGCGFNCINVRFNTAGVGNVIGTSVVCNNCNWTSSGPSEDYGAMIGNSVTNGPSSSSPSTSAEVVRMPYMSKFVISNNSMTNAGGGGGGFGALKMHNLSFNNNCSNGGSGQWGGFFTQYNEISDNYIAGSSGFQLIEMRPQNTCSDERMRYTVFERNVIAGTISASTARQLLISAVNVTVRDNAFVDQALTWGVCVNKQGIEPTPTGIEIYNNTFTGVSAEAIALITTSQCGGSTSTPVNSSFIQNNLAFITGGQATVFNTTGTNTVTNNTVTTTNNPLLTNGSGSFIFITDFKPTANFSGATSVPVWFDALGVAWPPTWDLGAVHH